jgi:ABC-type multidrug transport system fused ATPase/permease subunit
MNPKLISVDAKVKTPVPRLHARRLWRIVALAFRHRALLVLGLLATVGFACLHTFSIGAAFPVFKLLLEEEGLQGWTDRTVAGHRIGVTFLPAPDAPVARAVTVDSDSPLYRQGLRAGDRLRDTQGRTPAELFKAIANAEAEDTFTVNRVTSGTQPAPGETLTFTAGRLSRELRLQRWAVSLLPADADAQRLRTLTRLLLGLVVVIVLANVCRYFGEVLIAEAILRAMMQLRGELYDRTLQLPMSFFAGQSSADLVGRFVQDIQEIQRGLLTLFSKFIREPLRALFILGLAFALDWRITLTLLIVTPPAVAVFWRVGRSVKKSNRKLLQAYGHMIDALTTSLHNLRVVKAYTAERQERARLLGVDQRVLRQQVKLARLQAFVSPMMETVAVAAGSFLTVWLAKRVLSHDISISQFATLGVALSLLFDPLRKLTDVYVRIMRATAGADRIFHVIDQPVESDLSATDTELRPLERAIEYVDVSFTYPGAERPALRDVRLSIRKGETIAIVGPNGCGKTTLVSMLPRFFDPDAGVIRYDGVDIRQATLTSLRSQIGLVSQESIVFAGTPGQNIAYGAESMDPQRVEEAARRASADEYIRSIPGGYQAVLGERGSTLSGGQRQRLAIARAIFRDAPILIFDEATSQIDTESEAKIQAALRQFAKGRTTLIIAHRLSTIQFADRIVVMDAGSILDAGAHKDLFDRCSLYRNLCETQFVTETDGSSPAAVTP